jgi:hypothetical protein
VGPSMGMSLNMPVRPNNPTHTTAAENIVDQDQRIGNVVSSPVSPAASADPEIPPTQHAHSLRRRESYLLLPSDLE